MNLSSLRAHEAFCWLLGAGLGLTVSTIPTVGFGVSRWFTADSGDGVGLFVLLAQAVVFFGVGAFLGFLQPERPWRWAIAAILPVGLKALVLPLPPGAPEIPGGFFSVVALALPWLTTLSLLALAGAYLAAFLGTRREPQAVPPAGPTTPRVALRSRFVSGVLWTLLWTVVLGAAGFVGGFFGPILLARGGNQGPLLGIFYTGPLGAAGGFVLGVVLSLVRRWRVREMLLLLGIVSALYLGWILVAIRDLLPA